MNVHPSIKFLQHPNLGLLIIRLMLGVAGVYHGGQKVGLFGGMKIEAFADALGKMNFPMPTVSAWLAVVGEFGGGVMIALGLLPRLGAFLFAFTMAIAWGVAHKFRFDPTAQGNDAPFVLCLVCLGILFTGPGRFSLMALMSRAEPTAK